MFASSRTAVVPRGFRLVRSVSVTRGGGFFVAVEPTVDLAEFDQTYRLEHEQRFTPERTGQEVDVLIEVLKLNPLERVLDLGCGWGRHLSELKKRGFENLVGVDVQGAFLASVEGVTMLEGDAARLEFEAEFDAVYCAFSALLSTPDAASRVFSSVAKALKPGGRFLFDVTNRERLVQAGTSRSWRGGDRLPGLTQLPWVLEETRFDLSTGAQVISQTRVYPDGHTETRTPTRFHYTLAELVRLLQTAGLTVMDVYGDWQLNPYTAESPRTLLVSRKDT